MNPDPLSVQTEVAINELIDEAREMGPLPMGPMGEGSRVRGSSSFQARDVFAPARLALRLQCFTFCVTNSFVGDQRIQQD
jgi:hypothetical protein